MRAGAWTASLLLVAFGLAGCTSGSDDARGAVPTPTGTEDDAGNVTNATNATGNSTSTEGTNATTMAPPTANLTASLANGTAPLNVTFTMTGGADGPLAWTLDVDGDNVTDANGTLLPAQFNHTYEGNGTFDATLVVVSGAQDASATLSINVTAGSGGGALEEFSCTVDAPTAGFVWPGSPAGDLGECAFTTLDAERVLVAAAPADGCTINFDEDTSDTFAGGEAAVGETYPEGGQFTMQCEFPANTDGGTGTIGLQEP